MSVVVMIPARQGVGSLSCVSVHPAMAPFALRRLDHSLSLAVGLRSVAPRDAARDAQSGGHLGLAAADFFSSDCDEIERFTEIGIFEAA